jgi:AcrR family transcriptional regulator
MIFAADKQRAALLCATIELVAERGYSASSLAAVCERAHLSEEDFQEHFLDFEACVLAAFEQVISQIERQVRLACAGETCWQRRISLGLVALLGFLEEQPQCARFAVIESLGATQAVLRRRAQELERLAAIVDEGRYEGAFGADAGPTVAEGLLDTALTVVHESLLARVRIALLPLAAPLSSLIVLPYVGERASCCELEGARSGRDLGGRWLRIVSRCPRAQTSPGH